MACFHRFATHPGRGFGSALAAPRPRAGAEPAAERAETGAPQDQRSPSSGAGAGAEPRPLAAPSRR